MTNDKKIRSHDNEAFKAEIKAGTDRKQTASAAIVIRLPYEITPGDAIELLRKSATGRGRQYDFYELKRDIDKRWVEIRGSYTAVGASEDDICRKIASVLGVDKWADLSYEAS